MDVSRNYSLILQKASNQVKKKKKQKTAIQEGIDDTVE